MKNNIKMEYQKKQLIENYINPTHQAVINLLQRNISGSVIMLNLLRFREFADYTETLNLKPSVAITGKEAFQLYIEHTLPYLQESGGEIIFMGQGGSYLVGPENERWDQVMLIKQNSVNDFLSFASNKKCMEGIGHRTAALEDSRLLPLLEIFT